MKRILNVGHIDLSFHAVSAAVVRALLNQHGIETRASAAPHKEMFARLGRGDVDALVPAGLPSSHGRYVQDLGENAIPLATLYEPYCIWAVSPAVPADAVRSVEDLKQADVLSRMQRTIRGINPGAGISRFSMSIIERYGLDELGYSLVPGGEADFVASVRAGATRGDWFVIPIWHPQFLHQELSLRAVDEPFGLWAASPRTERLP